MNERIIELADKAVEDISSGPWNISDEFCIKFAQLIVRECIQVCNSRVGNSDYNTGRMHCVSDLKEHFGVEE